MSILLRQICNTTKEEEKNEIGAIQFHFIMFRTAKKEEFKLFKAFNNGI